MHPTKQASQPTVACWSLDVSSCADTNAAMHSSDMRSKTNKLVVILVGVVLELLGVLGVNAVVLELELVTVLRGCCN
jgi:hypothetical protein